VCVPVSKSAIFDFFEPSCALATVQLPCNAMESYDMLDVYRQAHRSCGW
jgi:hypothetical protein